ncbi:MAG: MotA/TolQ/ExbB proton channel family protein [Lentisphaeria bacterium]|nr:MotA/TolQ/ExbB proton channel family protein [Lentisphaeria bacterium]
MEFFKSFIQIMQDGGPVMWVILGCSVLALAVFLEKVFQFHRDEINVRELLHGLINVLKRDGLVEALTLCDSTPGPAARLLGAAILAYQRGDSDIRQAVDDAALDELPKLERRVNLLGTLGFVLPLIGFLGTVLGMLRVFEPLRTSETFSADIGGAVTSALITTAAALATAIPCYLGHNYLVARVNAITLDMEKAALEITAFFERRRAAAAENRAERP